MKYKKYAALTLAVILAGTTLAGCGRQEEEIVEEPVAAVEEIVEEPVEEEESIAVIGDWQNASESVMMTNQMGGTIIGLAIKLPEDAEYPENLMETDQWFMNGEQAMVYYEPPAGTTVGTVSGAEETAEITGTITGVVSDVSVETTVYESGEGTEGDSEVLTEAEAVASAWAEANAAALLAANADTAAAEDEAIGLEGEYAVSEGETEVIEAEAELAETEAVVEADLPEVNVDDLGYFLEVTMENNKVYEITCFPIYDMDEVTLCYDDDVAYLQYTSISEGTVVNTKAVEIIIRNNKEAADAVTAMIAALPAVSELNAEAVAEQAAQARVSYNNLTPAQRAYVTNLVHLEELENSIKILLGEDALDALIGEKELEDTDAIDADIEITETYETSDVGGMAYRETYEDTEEWDGEYGDYGNDYGNEVSTTTDEDQLLDEDNLGSVNDQNGEDQSGTNEEDDQVNSGSGDENENVGGDDNEYEESGGSPYTDDSEDPYSDGE